MSLYQTLLFLKLLTEQSYFSLLLIFFKFKRIDIYRAVILFLRMLLHFFRIVNDRNSQTYEEFRHPVVLERTSKRVVFNGIHFSNCFKSGDMITYLNNISFFSRFEYYILLKLTIFILWKYKTKRVYLFD